MSKGFRVAGCVAILCVFVGALLWVALWVPHSFGVFGGRIMRTSAQNNLYYDCEVGNADDAAHILKSYPDLANAQRDDVGGTPLAVAAAFGHSDVVALLIKHGADVNARQPLTGYTPLMRAIGEQKTEVVRQLLAAGAKVNLFDKYNETALHIAATGITSKDLSIVKLLVEAGSDVNACKGGGGTPLAVVEHAGNPPGSLRGKPVARAISKYLREHGAKVSCSR